MSRRKIVSAVLVLGLSASSLAHAGGYEMKDLEALEKQQSWQEIIGHLGDIPPSKRNDAWQKLAEKAGAGYLASVEGDEGVAVSEAILKQYPMLKKSKPYMTARADAGIKAFKANFSESRHSIGDDPWRDALKKFVADDTVTDLPLRAGKLVVSRLVAYIALPFFKQAIETTSGAGACKDADVKSALVSALSENEWTDDAKALVDKSCFGDVRGAIETELKKTPPSDNLKKNACPIFAAKKATIAACK